MISGPHVFNAQDIADMFVDLGACRMVGDASELAAAVSALLTDTSAAAAAGRKGMEIVQENRSALARLLDLLEPLI